VKEKGGAYDRKEITMRQGDLFRICHAVVAIFFVLFLARPAHALWLDVTGQSYPVVAPLVINLDALKPPPGDMRHGLFALPPPSANAADPRLKLQYRADFPLSVTFETSGALTADHVAAAGALNLTTRIIFVDRWWSPQVSASLWDISLNLLAVGHMEAGASALRSEWKLRF
jgi:hypothetical protein